MATDATGTPTSPDSIPKYNTAVDAPSGKGLNAIVDALQTALSTRISKSLVTTTGDIIYASAASTPARLGVGSTGQVLTVTGGVPVWASPSASSPGYGTAFPGSPTDGQEYILVDSTTVPTYQWRFRYNSGSSSSYKWEFIGGAPILKTVDVPGTLTFTSQNDFHDPASAGPAFTTPIQGDWEILYGTVANVSGANYQCRVGVLRGGTAPTVVGSAVFYIMDGVSTYGGYAEKILALAASSILKVQYANAGVSGDFALRNSWLSIVPIRAI